MTHQIFFSWQSDTLAKVSRNFIERSLQQAINGLRADAEIDPADREMVIDRDTLDVPGSPPIMETIFAKVDEATVFVSDLTYVASRDSGGRSPNPNVCIEHGYALKSLGWRRMIAVMNTAFGHPDQEELPFDVRHARRPILFNCPPDADDGLRRAVKAELAAHLGIALRSIFRDEAAQASMRAPAPAEPHPHDIQLLESVRQQLSPSLRRFLRQQNFGTQFRFAVLDPLHQMNDDWVGAAYEFHDAELQASFADFRRISNEFTELIIERTYATDRNPEMGWPKD